MFTKQNMLPFSYEKYKHCDIEKFLQKILGQKSPKAYVLPISYGKYREITFRGHFMVKIKYIVLENVTIEFAIQKYIRMVIIYF